MTGFYNEVLTVLRQDDRFFSRDGRLLRNAVYEAAMQMDRGLLRLLLSHPDTREAFFTDVDGVSVFDKVKFGWVVSNRQFLPDSYTRFRNKIGLADGNGELISASGRVELVFPYKDCVLEGGQTKEDQKRSEIFYHETLAPDEVDRLLYPKVFTRARRYVKEDGGILEQAAREVRDTDNLVIQGNNLLSIASLLKRYEGQVKCIYIDPPYNTGNDSFGYNDRFNQSTWLTFMKTRLEIARKLLRRDGTIAVSVDNYEIGYTLVLMDEIFGRENRKNIITIKRGSVTGAKVINPGVVNIAEYVVIYSRDTAQWRPNRVYAAKGFDIRYGTFILNYDEGYQNWRFTTVLEAWADECGLKKSALKSHFGAGYEEELSAFALRHAGQICQLATLDDHNISQAARELKRLSQDHPDTIYFMDRDDGKPYYVKNGKLLIFASDRLTNVDGQETFSQPVTDIWDDVLPNDIHNEGGVELKKGKKPEKLVGRILELCTNERDLVVDFFAGSGTTGACCLKMNRRFVLCEQLEAHIQAICQRLRNTMAGDARGISASCHWQGGGSFVSCRLARLNQNFADEIQEAQDAEALTGVYRRMVRTGFISCKVRPADIDAAAGDFAALGLAGQKRFLMELLDKNLLYVNLCDMDDGEFAIGEEDKAFTRSFYGEG